MLESLGRVGSLRRGILGLWETFGLSLALLALVMASSLATSSRRRASPGLPFRSSTSRPASARSASPP